jgi:hypothetical protein
MKYFYTRIILLLLLSVLIFTNQSQASNEIKRDGRFIAYDNGTVLDTKTNLMWAAKDNGSNIDPADAISYCQNYRAGGYTDWRMPTREELATLYDDSITGQNGFHLTKLITLTWCCVWTSEQKREFSIFFNFNKGDFNLSHRAFMHALPVRSGK